MDIKEIKRILPLLKIFKKKYNALLIPNNFKVPKNDEWPQEFHGFKLGELASNLKNSMDSEEIDIDTIKILEEEGFQWRKDDENFRKTIEALEIYKKLNGDLNIPVKYVISPGNNWPEHLWGYNIGKRAFFLRSHFEKLKNYKKLKLKSIGFELNLDEYQRKRNINALKIYKNLHGDLMIPRKYKVPFGDDRWPSNTWGLNLGIFVNSLRNKLKHTLTDENLEELNEMGFSFNDSAKNKNLTLIAIERFKEIYGHVNIPDNFVVPEHDSEWDDELARLPLGRNVITASLSKFLSKHYPQLYGEKYESSSKSWKNELPKMIQALPIYKEIYGNLFIPVDFIVPFNENLWPNSLHGLKLGKIASSVRKYPFKTGHSPQYFDRFGFIWDLKMQTSFNLILSLKYFKLFHNHLRIPKSYQVPSFSTWPKDLEGFGIGNNINKIFKKNHQPYTDTSLLKEIIFFDENRILKNYTSNQLGNVESLSKSNETYFSYFQSEDLTSDTNY